MLWHRLLGWPASESGTLCRGDGGPRTGRPSPERAKVAYAQTEFYEKHYGDSSNPEDRQRAAEAYTKGAALGGQASRKVVDFLPILLLAFLGFEVEAGSCNVAKPELPTNVYRVDGKTGQMTVAAGDINRPNGLAFSPDESKLYVVEAGLSPRVIQVYDVVDGGTRLSNKRTFLDAGPGTPDGYRCDVDGNLWCGWGMGQEGLDGVSIFDPDGKLIGRIDLPERCANLCFGGTQRNRLFMAASTSIYSLYVNTQGAPGG